MYRFLIQLQGSLTSLVYSYTMEMRAATGSKIDGVALMGADIERIVVSLSDFHELWASTIEVCIAVVLLERQLGIACVVPGIIVIGKSVCQSARAPH